MSFVQMSYAPHRSLFTSNTTYMEFAGYFFFAGPCSFYFQFEGLVSNSAQIFSFVSFREFTCVAFDILCV